MGGGCRLCSNGDCQVGMAVTMVGRAAEWGLGGVLLWATKFFHIAHVGFCFEAGSLVYSLSWP